MKPLSVLLCFLFLAYQGYAQQLTLRQLLKLRAMEQGQINRKLQKKGWTFVSDSPPSSDMMGKVVWAYEPVSEGAIAWCVLYYNSNSPSRILYNTYGGNAIHWIRRKVKRRGMDVLEEGTELERVVHLQSYQDIVDKQYVMRLLRYSQADGYGIKIFRKEDYFKAEGNNRL